MSTIPIHARSLPLYEAGVAAGQDIGLRLALDQLTPERIHQEQLAAQHPDNTLTYVYADGVLSTVAKTVAAIFRQETSR